MENNWDRKEEWWLRGIDFIVVVKHWNSFSYIEEKTINHWNVYGHVYTDHPYFNTLKESSLQNFPYGDINVLHCGCTFFQKHFDEKGEITSIQFGSDYGHLYDEWVKNYETEQDAKEVFYDAENLHKILTELGNG